MHIQPLPSGAPNRPSLFPGIVHGDIKTDNVLVFEDEAGNLTAKVIDFGYSCFGTCPSSMVTVPRTKGWYAPEHEPGKLVEWADAQKMDLFSFGLVVCRLLLWEELTSAATSKGLLLLPVGEGDNNSAANLDSMVDELKRTVQFLELTLQVLDTLSNVTGHEKKILRTVLSLTLDPNPSLRATSFSEIISIMDNTPDRRPLSFQPVHIDKLCEEVVEV